MKDESKKSHKFLRITAWFFASVAVLICSGFAFLTYELKPVNLSGEEIVKKVRIPSGTSTREAAAILKQEGLIRSDLVFYIAARFHLLNEGKPFVLKSGVYTVKDSMSLEEIYILMQSGEQEYISLSIPEGLTMRKIGILLEEKGVCRAEEFINACKSEKLISEYKIPAQSFEGYLFPDTYFFTPDMEAELVVRKLADTFFEKINSVEELCNLEPEKLYYTLTLASIIEKEYRVAEEAPIIASVFSNRLRRNIGLYSCATVEYIITEIEDRPHPDKITYDDLKIDSPYNTYKYAGLTPSPISNPGMVALTAAAKPKKTSYYYFVLTDPVKGTHTFSKDFDEHIAAEKGIPTKR